MYKQSNKQSTIVMLQSLKPTEFFERKGLKTMTTEFPVINTMVLAQDNMFPPLNWQMTAFKTMVERMCELGDMLVSMITLARYSMIPVGNLEQDCSISAIDNLYARSLSINKHVLWYSNLGLPDLGGHEDQDFRSFFREDLDNPEFIQKGFYRGYTAEIEIGDLAINTILQSEFLKEFEEAGMSMNNQQMIHYETGSKQKWKGRNQDGAQDTNQQMNFTTQFDTDLDEFITCSQSFKKLKDLVTSMYDDYLKGDESSGYLISHMYRWLSSSHQSKLFDPLLLRLIHKLMTKNFLKLLHRFK